jgi:broad specificity phosphatase PhoE
MEITKTVYFVRHGESVEKPERVHQNLDAVLSDNGIKQAELLAKQMAGLPIGIIFSSPLQRARQTAEIINHVLQKPIEFSDLLVETRKPSELIGKEKEGVEAKAILAQFDLHGHEEDWKYSDEESFSERKQRAARTIELITCGEHAQVLVVAHGEIIRFILAYMLFGKEMTPAEAYRFVFFMRADNTGVATCHLWGQDSWSLAGWNDLSHLNGRG